MLMTTENLWETFHTGLRHFILQRIPGEQSADDVLQETFLKIHTRIATLRDEEKLQSWMYQIARFSRVRTRPDPVNPCHSAFHCV